MRKKVVLFVLMMVFALIIGGCIAKKEDTKTVENSIKSGIELYEEAKMNFQNPERAADGQSIKEGVIDIGLSALDKFEKDGNREMISKTSLLLGLAYNVSAEKVYEDSNSTVAPSLKRTSPLKVLDKNDLDYLLENSEIYLDKSQKIEGTTTTAIDTIKLKLYTNWEKIKNDGKKLIAAKEIADRLVQKVEEISNDTKLSELKVAGKKIDSNDMKIIASYIYYKTDNGAKADELSDSVAKKIKDSVDVDTIKLQYEIIKNAIESNRINNIMEILLKLAAESDKLVSGTELNIEKAEILLKGLFTLKTIYDVQGKIQDSEIVKAKIEKIKLVGKYSKAIAKAYEFETRIKETLLKKKQESQEKEKEDEKNSQTVTSGSSIVSTSGGLVLNITSYSWKVVTQQSVSLTFGSVVLAVEGYTNADKITIDTYGDGLKSEKAFQIVDGKFTGEVTISFTHAVDSVVRKYTTIVKAYKDSIVKIIKIESGEISYIKEDESKKPRIELKADKYIIKANGSDFVTLNAELTNLTNSAIIYYVNGKEISSNIFATTQAGVYFIFAKAGNVYSNKVQVTAEKEIPVEEHLISSDKNEILADGVDSARFFIQPTCKCEPKSIAYYANDNKLEGNTFNTTVSGVYVIYAVIDGKKSNEIKIAAKEKEEKKLEMYVMYGNLNLTANGNNAVTFGVKGNFTIDKSKLEFYVNGEKTVNNNMWRGVGDFEFRTTTPGLYIVNAKYEEIESNKVEIKAGPVISYSGRGTIVHNSINGLEQFNEWFILPSEYVCKEVMVSSYFGKIFLKPINLADEFKVEGLEVEFAYHFYESDLPTGEPWMMIAKKIELEIIQKRTPIENLTLCVSKNTILSDGVDFAELGASLITSSAINAEYYVNDIKIEGNKFSTTTPGVYVVYAKYNEMYSNKVEIKASLTNLIKGAAGIVTYVNLEGGFYAITPMLPNIPQPADATIAAMPIVKSVLVPTNLPAVFCKNGISIIFDYEVLANQVSTTMYGTMIKVYNVKNYVVPTLKK